MSHCACGWQKQFWGHSSPRVRLLGLEPSHAIMCWHVLAETPIYMQESAGMGRG